MPETVETAFCQREYTEFSIPTIQQMIQDLLDTVSNTRYLDRKEYEELVSYSILVELLIEQGIKAGLVNKRQRIKLPRELTGIHFIPNKSLLAYFKNFSTVLTEKVAPNNVDAKAYKERVDDFFNRTSSLSSSRSLNRNR
jgi:hypothetical protein